MSYTYLQEQGEESSAECFSDIEQSVRLKLSLTAEKSYCNDNETVFCRGSQFGTMCEPLMENRGEELQTLCVVGSPARTSVLPETEKDCKGNKVAFGLKWPESLTKFDLLTYSWKTAQCSLFGGLTEFLGTWPKWGLMQGGQCWEREILGATTDEEEYGFWPTPTKSWSTGREGGSGALEKLIGIYGTPEKVRSIWKNLSPSFVETLMMWPEGWTGLQPLATDKFQQWLLAHGEH
jgi:hypothetical protein